MTSPTSILRWWEDRQVEVRLGDGRRCRGWVRETRAARMTDRATLSISHEPFDEDIIGRMIITLLPESGPASHDAPFPDEVTVNIGKGGEYGRPRGVRLLVGEEALFAGQILPDLHIRLPRTE